MVSVFLCYSIVVEGHIASLFPPVDSEAFREDCLVVHTTSAQFAVKDRISVNFLFMKKQQQNDCEFVFLMSGQEKKQIWDKMEQIAAEKVVDQETIKQYPALALFDKQVTVFFHVQQ